MTHYYKNIRRSVRVMLCAVALAGCTFQTYSPKPLDPAERMQQFQAHDPDSADFKAYLESQGYQADVWPLTQWGLRELTFSALYFHPQLDVARAQLQASQARELTAGQRPDPSVSGSVGKSEDDQAPWIYSIGLDIPLQTSSKRELSLAQAQSLSEATRIEIGQAAWEVRSRLLSSWLDYNASLQQSSYLQQEVDIHNEIMSMLNKRVEVGVLSNAELGVARLQLQQAQQKLIAQRGRIPELKAVLASNAGLTPETLGRLSLAPPPTRQLQAGHEDQISRHGSDVLQDAALLNRLDIRAALARYEAAERKLRLEIARQYPDITLSPSYIYEEGFHIWQLGIGALLPLLNKNKGLIEEARALREVEAAQFEALQANVIGILAQARARYFGALDTLEHTRQQSATSRQQLQRLTRQFDSGYADRLEVAYARLEDLQATQNLIAAEFTLQRAVAALEDALQQPLEFAGSLPDNMEHISPQEPHNQEPSQQEPSHES